MADEQKKPYSIKSHAASAAPHGRLAAMDRWMESNPWHPRVAPWGTYLVFMAIIAAADELIGGLGKKAFGDETIGHKTYPFLYVIQCLTVVWLLRRYRRLTPELTLKFHWLAVPAGLAVACIWINFGIYMVNWFPSLKTLGAEPFFDDDQMGPVLGWTALSLRLLGMSIVVPMFEELFNRSLLLRSLHRPRETWLGVVQVLSDLPVLGDWIMHTKVGERAAHAGSIFTREFERTPFGALSLFGVLASTLVFMSVHHWRDWPACFLCGVIYCLVVGVTRDKGLGPVIWTHGITNAALWVYTLAEHFFDPNHPPIWPFL